MINMFEVNETNKMIDPGESGCPYHHHGHQPSGLHRSDDLETLNQNIYDKITTVWLNDLVTDRRGHRAGITGFPS